MIFYQGFRFRFLVFAILGTIFSLPSICAADDDDRNQYPLGLSNSYVEINLAHINYLFSEKQLEPGYRVESVNISHLGVRLGLGHNFNEYLSAQVTYARPVSWLRYENISNMNGLFSSHSVIINMAGLTARWTMPVKSPFSVYVEGGLGIITRSGFKVRDQPVLSDANYPTVLAGAGLKYRLNKKWDFQTGASYSPSNKKFQQPAILIVSGGGVFNMRPLSAEEVKKKSLSKFIFPRNLVQVGYVTDTFGTGVNNLVSHKLRIFWGGNAEVKSGTMFLYQRNIFHTKKIFAFDWGASIAGFRSVEERRIFSTVSVFPQIKFIPVRSGFADMYLTYSLMGPAYVSRTVIDGVDTGRHFSFQYMMGAGCYLGKEKSINAEVRIGHYSNGNLFPRNPGIQMPLTFNFGVVF